MESNDVPSLNDCLELRVYRVTLSGNWTTAIGSKGSLLLMTCKRRSFKYVLTTGIEMYDVFCVQQPRSQLTK